VGGLIREVKCQMKWDGWSFNRVACFFLSIIVGITCSLLLFARFFFNFECTFATLLSMGVKVRVWGMDYFVLTMPCAYFIKSLFFLPLCGGGGWLTLSSAPCFVLLVLFFFFRDVLE
jgi:hypothetical protein